MTVTLAAVAGFLSILAAFVAGAAVGVAGMVLWIVFSPMPESRRPRER